MLLSQGHEEKAQPDSDRRRYECPAAHLPEKVLKAFPERKKKSRNGQILEVEAMRRCVISRFGDYDKN